MRRVFRCQQIFQNLYIQCKRIRSARVSILFVICSRQLYLIGTNHLFDVLFKKKFEMKKPKKIKNLFVLMS